MVHLRMFRQRSADAPKHNHDLVIADHPNEEQTSRTATKAGKNIGLLSNSDKSYSSETCMNSSFESNSNLIATPSASEVGVSTCITNDDFSVDDLSLGDNFGQSIMTVWSVAPGMDCDSAIFFSTSAEEEDAISLNPKDTIKATDLGNDAEELETRHIHADEGNEYKNAVDENQSLQYRINSDLDSFTFPRRHVKNSKRSWQKTLYPEPTLQKVLEPNLAKQRFHQKHDPSAKFAFSLESMGDKPKPRGRDPSVIQISNDNSNHQVLITSVDDETDFPPKPKCSLLSNNSRPDPPVTRRSQELPLKANTCSTDISKHVNAVVRVNIASNKVQQSKQGIHQRQNQEILPSFQVIHNASLDTAKPLTCSNKRRGGLRLWFYRKRVTV